MAARKFLYDVWGDTVNLANRLDTSAEPNRIHVSEDFANEVGDKFGWNLGDDGAQGQGRDEDILFDIGLSLGGKARDSDRYQLCATSS